MGRDVRRCGLGGEQPAIPAGWNMDVTVGPEMRQHWHEVHGVSVVVPNFPVRLLGDTTTHIDIVAVYAGFGVAVHDCSVAREACPHPHRCVRVVLGWGWFINGS